MERYGRADVVYYDTEMNGDFQQALADCLFLPAHFQALSLDSREGKKLPYTERKETVSYVDGRAEYGFLAAMGDRRAIVTSTLFSRLGDITPATIALMRSEITAHIFASELREHLLSEIDGPIDLVRIETFVARTFCHQLDTGSVRVRTDLGYAVDGYEIWPPDYFQMDTELDIARRTVFEGGEIVELVRALMSLELINQANVEKFLKKRF